MRLDAQTDRRELTAALRDHQAGLVSLAELRRAAEAIVDRWRDRSLERPPFSPDEIPLWNVVWDLVTGCRESLGSGGIARLQAILEGRVALHSGGPDLRP